jgi:signal peptidase
LVDALLVTLVGLVVFAILLGRVVPLTGRQTLVILSGSMSPAIPVGAAVIVEHVDSASLSAGDVVAVRVGSAGTMVTHRVTRIVHRDDELWLETKGDANPSVDPALTPGSALIGRVGITLPLAGYLLRLLSVPAGIGLVLSLAALLLTVGAFGTPPQPGWPSPRADPGRTMLGRWNLRRSAR